jgi:hypothetical protein
MSRVLLAIVFAVMLAVALVVTTNADCVAKCKALHVLVTETPRERGSGCGWYGPATPTWSICPTHTPTP